MNSGGDGAAPPPRRLRTKSYSPPRRGRIALPANERITEFLDFVLQAKLADANKLGGETFLKEGVDKFRRVSYNIHVASLVHELNMR